ncbi:diguanylate cyclase [Ramlibacter sp.]|uniref:diguanylate cyclase domain-containing protein n=1 Tax=Ramlibacter sp. TaxID=1917967 RepID=UPI00260CAF65|nr:diguanylate cyclase [Ramlibacter sp.]MDB5953578.1 regulator protein domain, rane protein-like protein [Ramlibacter sp.]
MTDRIDPAQLWLGAFVGAQVLLVFLCVLQANAYRERPPLLHAAATLMAVVAVQSQISGRLVLPPAVLLLVPALAGLQLLDLMSHAGGLRQVRRWLLIVSAGVLPLLAVGAVYNLWALAGGMTLWTATVLLLLVRAWRQSKPWVWWLLPGLVCLMVAGFYIAADATPNGFDDAVAVAALLAVWSACTYLATDWRGRIFGETQARVQGRNTVDPLTGLATPLVLAERVLAARHLTRRYGHPSVLMVVHIENLPALGAEFGPEAIEAAVLAAAIRVRESLMRDGDVAARLTHARIGVLAEGVATGQAASTVAGRILVAGLKEPLPAFKSEFLRFRIVMAAVPTAEVAPKALLQRLNHRLDQEVQTGSERRIVTVTQEELLV